MKHLFMTLVVLFSAFSVQAEDMADLGPAVGTTIPHMLELKDQNGNKASFKSTVGEKGTVIVFYRSASWCPFCQMQLIDLNLNAAEGITSRGYSVVGVSYDDTKKLSRFSKKWNISFPLLSDEGSKAIDAFGIRNEQFASDHYAYGVPHPVILIVDNKGTIKAKLFEEGYRDRPTTEAINAALDAL